MTYVLVPKLEFSIYKSLYSLFGNVTCTTIPKDERCV